MFKEILEELGGDVIYILPKEQYPKGSDRKNYVEVTFEVDGKKYAILLNYPKSTGKMSPAIGSSKKWGVLPPQFQKTESGTPMYGYTTIPEFWKRALQKRGAKNVKFDYTWTNKR